MNMKLRKFWITLGLGLAATLTTAQMFGLVNQKPKEVQAQSGWIKLRNRNYSSKCLNLQAPENRNGGIPNVWDCVSYPDQDWKIETLSSQLPVSRPVFPIKINSQ